ncbi:MAG: protein phosphatase 2C domain-containing protein [Planctomycetota bacterium]
MPTDSQQTPSALVIRAVSRTDVGMRRATNQDSVAIVPSANGNLLSGDAVLMVADGMGAHAAGELASKMAVETIPHTFLKSAGQPAHESLRKAISEANTKINGKGASSADFQGMGTTCSCLVIVQGSAVIGHVGDSRVYRLRHGELAQLTFDHSLVWEMAAASKVAEDKVPSCIPKNVITRSLGPHETVNVDLEGPEALEEGDTFLLCSDGLTAVVDDPLAASLLATLEPAEAADALINLANLRGGPDNISVIVARVEQANSGQNSGVTAVTPSSPTPRAGGIVAAAASLLLGGWCLTQSHTVGMFASAIGLVASIVYAFTGRPATEPSASPQLSGGPYGKGPYRRSECGDHAAAAGDLRDVVAQLAALHRDSDVQEPGSGTERSDGMLSGINNGSVIAEPFSIDWTPFTEPRASADAAFEAGDFGKATVAYARLVGEVMQAVREDDGTHRYKTPNEVVS